MDNHLIPFALFTDIMDKGVSNPLLHQLNNDTKTKLQNIMNIVCPNNRIIPYVFKKYEVKYEVKEEDNQTEKTWFAPKLKATVVINKNLTEEATQLNNIRVLLNKLTDKNYDDFYIRIENELQKFNPIPIEISKFIIDISTINVFYVKIYAALYIKLSIQYPILKTYFLESIQHFTTVFDDIIYISPEVDYNGFCLMTGTNKKRRALSEFISQLTIFKLIDKNITTNIVDILFTKFLTWINQENKINETDEIVENLILLFKAVDQCIPCQYLNNKTIHEMINEIKTYKSKNFKSLSSKSIFKFMDLQDTKDFTLVK